MLPRDLENKLTEYRKVRKSQTGQTMFRDTAIVELLRSALENFVPPQPIESRLDEIEKRLQRLESAR